MLCQKKNPLSFTLGRKTATAVGAFFSTAAATILQYNTDLQQSYCDNDRDDLEVETIIDRREERGGALCVLISARRGPSGAVTMSLRSFRGSEQGDCSGVHESLTVRDSKMRTAGRKMDDGVVTRKRKGAPCRCCCCSSASKQSRHRTKLPAATRCTYLLPWIQQKAHWPDCSSR